MSLSKGAPGRTGNHAEYYHISQPPFPRLAHLSCRQRKMTDHKSPGKAAKAMSRNPLTAHAWSQLPVASPVACMSLAIRLDCQPGTIRSANRAREVWRGASPCRRHCHDVQARPSSHQTVRRHHRRSPKVLTRTLLSTARSPRSQPRNHRTHLLRLWWANNMGFLFPN